MEKIHFLGRVVPPGFNISVGFNPKITWLITQLNPNISVDIVVNIKDSNIDVECEITKFVPEQYVYVWIRAFDLARIAVDMVAFSTGASLTTIFAYFVHPDGTREPMRPQDQTLGAFCTAFRVNNAPGDTSYDDVFKIVAMDVELFTALRDLIEANTVPHIDIINCGRVLDGIKRMISPGVANPRTAWGAMHTALNVDQAYQHWVTNLSANPRHADRSYITGTDTVEAVRRTWAIMNRFLEYRKKGNIPLVPPEFPLLT